MNNTYLKRELKAWRQRRREQILEMSKGKKPSKGQFNAVIYLGGVIQKGRH